MGKGLAYVLNLSGGRLFPLRGLAGMQALEGPGFQQPEGFDKQCNQGQSQSRNQGVH